jgi:polyferredoxin
MTDEFDAVVQRNRDWLFFAMAVLPLAYHFFTKKKEAILTWGIGSALCLLAAALLVIASVKREPVSFSLIAGALTFYFAMLFVLLSEAMVQGLAKWLTKTRGEKWTKEMEYVYLTMAVVGIVGSMNRVEFLTGRLEVTEIVSAMLLVTAVAIRFLKTRAEIAGWNRPT